MLQQTHDINEKTDAIDFFIKTTTKDITVDVCKRIHQTGKKFS